MSVRKEGISETKETEGKVKEERKRERNDNGVFNDISRIMGRYSSHALSATGEKFIKDTKDYILNNDQHDIVLRKISSLVNAYMVIDSINNNGIILLFEESIRKDLKSIQEYGDFVEARESASIECPDVKIINGIIIPVNCYEKSAEIADFIIRSLKAESDELLKNLNIDSFKGKTLIIDTNINNLREFVQRTYPYINPKTDFGFIVYVGSDKFNAQESILNGATPIIGVTGYNEFIKQNQSSLAGGINSGLVRKFLPFVHISSIVSTIPSSTLLPLAIELAKYVFIDKRLYQRINRDVGQLIIDPDTKKPWKPESDDDIIKFMEIYFLNPILVADNIVGSLSIPKASTIMSESHQGIQSFNKFFLSNVPGFSLTKVAYSEIAGYVRYSGNIIDSREIDYLFMLKNIGANPEFEKMLVRFNPEDRVKFMQQYVEFVPLFKNTVLGINPQVGLFLNQLLNKVKVIVLSGQQQLSTIDFSQLLDFAVPASNYTGYQPTASIFNF